MMGLFSALVGLPLAPVRGVGWLAERIQEEAERQFYDPAAIRRQLEEVAEAKRAGTLPEDEAARLEQDLVARLLEGTQRRRRDRQ